MGERKLRELVALTQTLQKSELLALIPRALEPYLTHISEQLQPPAGCAELLHRAIAPVPEHATENIAGSALDTAVAALNPDNLSPREALEALYQLKALAGKG